MPLTPFRQGFGYLLHKQKKEWYSMNTWVILHYGVYVQSNNTFPDM